MEDRGVGVRAGGVEGLRKRNKKRRVVIN